MLLGLTITLQSDVEGGKERGKRREGLWCLQVGPVILKKVAGRAF